MVADQMHIIEIVFNSNLIMLGILLALYSLVLPLRKEILDFRQDQYMSKRLELQRIQQNIREEGDPERKEDLKNKKSNVRNEIHDLKKIPLYLGGAYFLLAWLLF